MWYSRVVAKDPWKHAMARGVARYSVLPETFTVLVVVAVTVWVSGWEPSRNFLDGFNVFAMIPAFVVVMLWDRVIRPVTCFFEEAQDVLLQQVKSQRGEGPITSEEVTFFFLQRAERERGGFLTSYTFLLVANVVSALLVLFGSGSFVLSCALLTAAASVLVKIRRFAKNPPVVRYLNGSPPHIETINP